MLYGLKTILIIAQTASAGCEALLAGHRTVNKKSYSTENDKIRNLDDLIKMLYKETKKHYEPYGKDFTKMHYHQFGLALLNPHKYKAFGKN